jgi:capsular polysaccharide biosynthesis protein
LSLKAYLAAVRRYWLTFILTTGVIFALGLTWLVLSPAKFVSSTQLMVSIEGFTTAAAYENDQVVERRINSYIPLLTSGVVTQRVIDKLNLPLTSAELAAKINATNVPPRTAIIDVAVTDESPERARRIAQTLASEFIRYTAALETPTGEDDQKVHTTVVTAASGAREDRGERVLLGVLAGLAALVVGAVAVWIRSRTDPIVRTAAHAADAGLPVLGRVMAAPATSVDNLEGYDRLWAQLSSATRRAGGANDRGGVLMLTSAVGEVHTATIASNLGRAMEFAGSRAIVLDARAPGAEVATDEPLAGKVPGNELNLGGAENTVEPANNWTEPNDAARVDVATAPKYALPEFERGADRDVVSVSGWPAEPRRLEGEVTPELIDHLCGGYEQVVIAAVPVLSTNAASALSEFAAEVLLVLSIGETTRRDLTRAAEKLRAMGAPPTGAILIGKDEGSVGSDRVPWLRKFRIRDRNAAASSSLGGAETSGVRVSSKRQTPVDSMTKGQ